MGAVEIMNVCETSVEAFMTLKTSHLVCVLWCLLVGEFTLRSCYDSFKIEHKSDRKLLFVHTAYGSTCLTVCFLHD